MRLVAPVPVTERSFAGRDLNESSVSAAGCFTLSQFSRKIPVVAESDHSRHIAKVQRGGVDCPLLERTNFGSDPVSILNHRLLCTGRQRGSAEWD